MDCTNNDLTFGCDGGFMEGALTQFQVNGITTDSAYKYTGKKSACKLTTGGTFRVESFKNI